MWRDRLLELFENENYDFKDGQEHCYRLYHMTLALGCHLPLDEEVVFAAAMMHDFRPFLSGRGEGNNRIEAAVEAVIDFLIEEGFPVLKTEVLREILLGNTGACHEAALLHDADLLDGIGAIGIARELSAMKRSQTGLDDALAMLEKRLLDGTGVFLTEEAKKIAKERLEELELFLQYLTEERG
ncbi:MAG: hypothetical protein ACOX8I_06715 [Bacillota bacterium]|jgi:uncharacterized protein